MLSERQSEILGIMFGDGAMSKVGGSIQIAVTGHKIEDKNYLINHVCPLFAQEFDVQMKSRYRLNENTMDIYVYSKKTASILNSWGMPLGLKNAGTLQPTVELAKADFVRGLFDTDGSIYRKYGKYKQIQFKGSSKKLMEYTLDAIIGLGFYPTALHLDETRYKFYLCRQKDVQRFFETISPANEKHQKRLQVIK
ncbi:MAG: LAGLIDADG family homing endonuclease [Candidatus Bathyarchaeia archaeon]|jgi:DNA-binding transcriptional regulator WhiA